MDVIGLSGRIGTGKDYIAKEYFFSRGYKQFSLAWHFKVWIIGKGEATYDDVFRIKSANIRHLLQQEGTEMGRMIYGEDVWVDTMFAWMKTLHDYWNIDKFIVPDVRFVNEVEAIKRHGGRVFRIVAPERDRKSGATPEARAHPSETSLDAYPLEDYDGLIYNDLKDKDTITNQIKRLLGEDV